MQQVDQTLEARLDAVCAEGRAIWERFDRTVREREFHPFVPADYDDVRSTLLHVHAPGQRFLEWGSATGVITVMADLIGFHATGIELDPQLAATARGLATRHGSAARFVTGSFLPTGYRCRANDGDARTGTIGDGASGYLELGEPLDTFDVVFGYPWDGELTLMRDVMDRYGRHDALLVLYDPNLGARFFRGGREVAIPGHPARHRDR